MSNRLYEKFLSAVLNDDIISMEKYLQKIPDIKTYNHSTKPIFHAIRHNSPNAVNFLIKNKFDINEVHDKYGTPLMYAVSTNNKEMFDILLPLTKDIFATNKKNESALTWAIIIRNHKMVSELMEKSSQKNNELKNILNLKTARLFQINLEK